MALFGSGRLLSAPADQLGLKGQTPFRHFLHQFLVYSSDHKKQRKITFFTVSRAFSRKHIWYIDGIQGWEKRVSEKGHPLFLVLTKGLPFCRRKGVCQGRRRTEYEGAVYHVMNRGDRGARIVVILLHLMAHRGAHLGLATLCVGGGQGMAIIVERK